VLTEKK